MTTTVVITADAASNQPVMNWWFLPATGAAQELRRLEPGTTIAVRTNQMIDVDRQDHRVYTGVVDADVRDTNKRIVVPRGSAVELSVRVARNNELVLDLESIVTNGQRYAIDANADRFFAPPKTGC